MTKVTGSTAQQTLPFKSTKSREPCEQKIIPTSVGQLRNTKTLKAFELDGVIYIRIIPGKKLFQSTMVHSVVTRGDIFAMRLEDSVFTIIPGKSMVNHFDLEVSIK
jgi:hypothetical protein